MIIMHLSNTFWLVLFHLITSIDFVSSFTSKLHDKGTLVVRSPRQIIRYASKQDDSDPTVDVTTRVIRKVLDIMRDSDLIDEKHAEHCASPSVTHLFKGTPLVNLPDELKLRFVDSWAGKVLATVMAEEQDYLGDWKIQKIIEAAGDDYDVEKVSERISNDINSNQIVVYSFVDCPWCVATKNLLYNNEQLYDPSLTTVIELEDCGLAGKHIRAELSKMTGRTSMPCIFVGGEPIGGFTDGDPCGPGIQKLHQTGELSELISCTI